MTQMHDLAAGNGTITAAIANAATRLHKEYTGRGPTSARTVVDGDLLTVLLRDVLTPAERRLMTHGKAELVKQFRREFHATMRDELVAAVEMLTQCSVIAFLSAHDAEADVVMHSFVVVPQSENGTGPSGAQARITDEAKAVMSR